MTDNRQLFLQEKKPSKQTAFIHGIKFITFYWKEDFQ